MARTKNKHRQTRQEGTSGQVDKDKRAVEGWLSIACRAGQSSSKDSRSNNDLSVWEGEPELNTAGGDEMIRGRCGS